MLEAPRHQSATGLHENVRTFALAERRLSQSLSCCPRALPFEASGDGLTWLLHGQTFEDAPAALVSWESFHL